MGAIPGNIETDRKPPMTVPLRHFLVALGFLLTGVGIGLGLAVDAVPGLGTVAHVHLLLAGWICITIMGAMTQFVPVWSGTELHSQRLASVQLALVAAGLVGFVVGLVTTSLSWLLPFGGLMLLGFWTFVYNVGRTLVTLDSYDLTERHFLLSLGFFPLLTVLGLVLAAGYSQPVFAELPVGRSNVVVAHATLAVFGAVLTTIYGALYQLATMFTQTELHGIDESLRLVEEVGHPLGVLLLAVGRFWDVAFVARLGGVLVLTAAVAFGTILARKLYEMKVDWTPMHTRYAVVVPGLMGWALVSAPTWLRAPVAPQYTFGAVGGVHLFVLGTVGFVVLGTLYHIVPFIVWVHRYSDLLGLEPVPMVDDLYDDRLARTDAVLLVGGTLLLVLGDWFALGLTLQVLAGALVGLGVAVFTANMLLIVRAHSPHSVGRIVLGSLDPRTPPASPTDRAAEE